MDYSHELLALFNPASHLQSIEPDWMQLGFGGFSLIDIDGDENFNDNASKFNSKYTSSGGVSACPNINSRSQDPNECVQEGDSGQSSGSSMLHPPQNSQFLMSADTYLPGLLLEAKTEETDDIYQPNFTEQKVSAMAQARNESLPFVYNRFGSQTCAIAANLQAPFLNTNSRRFGPFDNAYGGEYTHYIASSPCKEFKNSKMPRNQYHSLSTFPSYSHEGVKPCMPSPQVYEIVRGVASGSVTRPPFVGHNSNYEFVPIQLTLLGALIEEINRQPWTCEERQDGRRIVRMERTQNGHIVNASFLVVGLALRHPTPRKASPEINVVEVSCLNHILADEEEDMIKFSITSVEVVKIIETLIALTSMTLSLRRKEKGRIRLNLRLFWLKKPLLLKKTMMSNQADSRTDFARRVMKYEVRKPRRFDKDVRILLWEKLGSALHRALQCYYAQVPKKSLESSLI